mgnify:CR=1 FL=1
MRNDHCISRRAILAAAGALPLLMATARWGQAENLPLVSVSKDPSCGCCDGWAAHIEAAGFPVRVVESADMASLKRCQRRSKSRPLGGAKPGHLMLGVSSAGRA